MSKIKIQKQHVYHGTRIVKKFGYIGLGEMVRSNIADALDPIALVIKFSPLVILVIIDIIYDYWIAPDIEKLIFANEERKEAKSASETGTSITSTNVKPLK